MKLPHIQFETRVVLLYLFFGGLWILLSDRLLVGPIQDPQALTRFQTYKGWIFVTASALLLYLLLRQSLAHERSTLTQLNETNERYRLLFESSLSR